AWVDIFAATNNHVALAIDDIEKALRIAVADIAGVKPAVAKCRRSRLGISIVAFQNILASKNYFSDLAVSHFLIILIDHLHLISNRHAARPGASPQVRRI